MAVVCRSVGHALKPVGKRCVCVSTWVVQCVLLQLLHLLPPSPKAHMYLPLLLLGTAAFQFFKRWIANAPPPYPPLIHLDCPFALQLWFPTNYATVPSAFAGLSAMDYFLFLLNKLPAVAFTKDGIAGFDVTNLQVGYSDCWIN